MTAAEYVVPSPRVDRARRRLGPMAEKTDRVVEHDADVAARRSVVGPHPTTQPRAASTVRQNQKTSTADVADVVELHPQPDPVPEPEPVTRGPFDPAEPLGDDALKDQLRAALAQARAANARAAASEAALAKVTSQVPADELGAVRAALRNVLGPSRCWQDMTAVDAVGVLGAALEGHVDALAALQPADPPSFDEILTRALKEIDRLPTIAQRQAALHVMADEAGGGLAA